MKTIKTCINILTYSLYQSDETFTGRLILVRFLLILEKLFAFAPKQKKKTSLLLRHLANTLKCTVYFQINLFIKHSA